MSDGLLWVWIVLGALTVIFEALWAKICHALKNVLDLTCNVCQKY